MRAHVFTVIRVRIRGHVRTDCVWIHKVVRVRVWVYGYMSARVRACVDVYVRVHVHFGVWLIC